MRKTTLSIAVTLAFAVGIAAAAQSGKPGKGNSVFWVLHQNGHPLEQVIQPGHNVVEVRKDQTPPNLAGPPSNVGALEWWTKQAPIAVIISVQAVTPKLTPAGDWIESTVHAKVDAALKYSPATAIGHPVQFVQDGGDMVIRGTTVKAVLQYADRFEPGHRYLTFAEPTDTDGVLRVQPLLSFRIEGADDHLAPLAHQGRMATERGVTLSQATARITAALKNTP